MKFARISRIDIKKAMMVDNNCIVETVDLLAPVKPISMIRVVVRSANFTKRAVDKTDAAGKGIDFLG